MITDLDTSTVDPERAAIHVVEFFVWWMQVGKSLYGPIPYSGGDGGLQEFARDSVKAIGGWQAARRVLRELDTTTRILIEGKASLV